MSDKAKSVYSFGKGRSDGNASMRNTLGGKGANLCEMTKLGLPVPPGFVISTGVCVHVYKNRWRYPTGLKSAVAEAMTGIEKIMGKKFGDPQNPLLLSVRSGARTSMPGMMDSILNLGLTEETVKGLAAQSGNSRFAYDSYRRFIQMYADVVMGVSDPDRDPFESLLDAKKRKRGLKFDADLTAEDLQDLVRQYKKVVLKKSGHEFPENPLSQLWGAIGAVFKSWMNVRAIEYRKIYAIPEEWGTAVTVMAMVFGNLGDDCATGVAFTRNPADGTPKLFGEYLINAQGEDVVAGVRTPLPIDKLSLKMPEAYKSLEKIAVKLERHYKDMQDIEFTVEKGRLWMLQCRNGKRTGLASIRIAVDMVRERLISKKTAVLRIEPTQLNHLLRPTFDLKEKERSLKKGNLLARGLNAGPGAASGQVVFHASDVSKYASAQNSVILVRYETSPEDIKGMKLAEGILTARGGMTSHAALVARQMGKVCIVGCESLQIDHQKKRMRVNGRTINQGDYISLDGGTGEVILGKLDTKPSEIIEKIVFQKKIRDGQNLKIYRTIMSWADQFRKMDVYANADQPDQCEHAISLGAQGIGLCRTEHMFFGENRISVVREIILSGDPAKRKKALKKLSRMQKKDFEGIFKVMRGLPVTIRTLDPPLHEFLPKGKKEIADLAREMGLLASDVHRKISELEEVNPMLGLRGCRLGILFPDIVAAQIEAMFEAACTVLKRKSRVDLEIMIPLVSHVNELKNQRDVVDQVAARVMREKKQKVHYRVGTMIEIPRAAITADKIARIADFFSFGTNDLTQTTFGLSRDDTGMFLPYYYDHGILNSDPFVTIDQEGVGYLMETAVARGKSANPSMTIGICGEHGGNPASVEFSYQLGLNYVSCSPYRLPIARMAAAQATLKFGPRK